MSALPGIVVRQPLLHDIVHNPIRVVGYSTAFEGTVQIRVRDRNEDVIAHTFFTGGANGTFAVFDHEVGLLHTPATARGFVEVYEESAQDGTPVNLVRTPVTFGIALIHEYHGFRQHTVAPGDTLSGIAQSEWGDASQWWSIHEANHHLIPDPDLIHPGMVLRIPQGIGF